MSIYPDVVYRHARRLEAWYANQPRVEADVLVAMMQAQAESRRHLLPQQEVCVIGISPDAPRERAAEALQIRCICANAA